MHTLSTHRVERVQRSLTLGMPSSSILSMTAYSSSDSCLSCAGEHIWDGGQEGTGMSEWREQSGEGWFLPCLGVYHCV